MKNPYLMTHIMTHLHTFARFYDKRYNLIETHEQDADFSDMPYGTLIVQQPLILTYDSSHHPPLLFTVNHTSVYAWIPIGMDKSCLLGPILITENATFKYNLDFLEESIPKNQPACSWNTNIPFCSISVFAEDIVLLYQMEHNDPTGSPPLNIQQLLAANLNRQPTDHRPNDKLYHMVFESIENGFAHNPYSQEQQECDCIRRGDVESLRRLFSKRFHGRYGTLSQNPVRQIVHLGIVSITLYSRAAIEGGLHYEVGYYLSDISISKLDSYLDTNLPVNLDDIEKIFLNVGIQYAELVHELQAKKKGDMLAFENRHISRCKDYVFAHLHEKITIQEVASAVGLEANYLSALFRKNEKISFKQFIINEKIRWAKNMLAYSTLSYAEIALNLGFSSQSHMGKEFKKITGMTPREYRLANSENDFVFKSMKS